MTEPQGLFAGAGAPVFIAEVSSNHHRDLERCYAFIEAAHRTGSGAVKFQLFRINELFAPEVLKKSPAHRARADWELPVGFIPKLAQKAHDLGMLFSCTPFYLDAVGELEPYVDFYKIASYELLWDDLLIACANTRKPVVLSTGMATMNEIAHARDVIHSAGCVELTLLHCVSSYPTPPEQMNLSALETLRNTFGVPTGLSDHSVNPGIIARAVHRFGAVVVEYHLDLDGEGEEFSAGHCWLPDQIAAVIENIETGFKADGDGIKQPAPSEMADRDWRADPDDGLRPLKSIRDFGDSDDT
ncbi:N-acetylneuraminate synthase family protein [Magnetovibrio sp.]|uniref:N-acetylneuraminate synthase family protein n=1 Tax=Magnetovibrio sp. TaxID=2024836 RepID=UPI002F9499F3